MTTIWSWQPASLSASRTQSSRVFPAASWSTLGKSLFMRVPLPAARTIAIGDVSGIKGFAFFYRETFVVKNV
jgi:hypothetical protein